MTSSLGYLTIRPRCLTFGTQGSVRKCRFKRDIQPQEVNQLDVELETLSPIFATTTTTSNPSRVKLHMQRSDHEILSPNFKLFVRNGGTIRLKGNATDTRTKCLFSGSLEGDPNSIATLSTCGTLELVSHHLYTFLNRQTLWQAGSFFRMD